MVYGHLLPWLAVVASLPHWNPALWVDWSVFVGVFAVHCVNSLLLLLVQLGAFAMAHSNAGYIHSWCFVVFRERTGVLLEDIEWRDIESFHSINVAMLMEVQAFFGCLEIG